MLVLKILQIVVVLVTAWVVLMLFDQYSAHRYGFRFFTPGALLAYGIAVPLLGFGNEWLEQARLDDGDELNGILLMSIGGLILFCILVLNISQTGLGMGVCGTAIQAAVAVVIVTVFWLVLAFVIFVVIACRMQSYRPYDPRPPY